MKGKVSGKWALLSGEKGTEPRFQGSRFFSPPLERERGKEDERPWEQGWGVRTIGKDLTKRGLGSSPTPSLVFFSVIYEQNISHNASLQPSVYSGLCKVETKKTGEQLQQLRKLSSSSNQVIDSCFSIFVLHIS